jgi:hypothetical protein
MLLFKLDKLVMALRMRRDASARELAALLNVSQPTISRLLAAAGDRICRIGRGRAARYACTRSIPSIGTQVPVRQIDEAGRVLLYGTIHLLANDRHWLQRDDGRHEFFDGLPPFALDMSPQGYIGRNFSILHPELELPPRIRDWSENHRLIALARRGEDCVGNLIIGDESFSRFLADSRQAVSRDDYPELAARSLQEQPGSSAGGEQPKFAVFSQGRHVLVKFASGEAGPITQRWKDLLVGECVALEVIREAAIETASAKVLDIGKTRFLEVERFDRVGTLGRRGVLSLFAVAAHYLGHLENWTKASRDLLDLGRIGPEDARKMRWLDCFGQLIGNNDRHFGNITFFAANDGRLQLAPVYDMLPMLFAPDGTNLVDRRFDPLPPTAENFDVWFDAIPHALAYWGRLAKSRISPGFRQICSNCRKVVEELERRVPRMGGVTPNIGALSRKRQD